ncbi:hypothetical protein SZN_35692 [Streptomyces zinciresistens K42]|uniref:Anti-sigma factor antagonist n=1 Tax=Streptomyces zinciresistens K42 TaxID=700597 RepID=G2GNN3_9ACTN|nr:STAS domain-containing protein [Streptomyces zinciresistens]EGX54882.1 hypothetical protein SZN_35692 [Streptomyces zinciresistens K42]
MPENPPRPAGSPAPRAVRGTTVLALDGEIDLVAATPLASRLDALTCVDGADLVLDLRDVSFIDCAGLGVLCRTRNRVRARNGRLRLVTRDGAFLRLLRVVGLAGAFEVQPHPPTGPATGLAPG